MDRIDQMKDINVSSSSYLYPCRTSSVSSETDFLPQLHLLLPTYHCLILVVQQFPSRLSLNKLSTRGQMRLEEVRRAQTQTAYMVRLTTTMLRMDSLLLLITSLAHPLPQLWRAIKDKRLFIHCSQTTSWLITLSCIHLGLFAVAQGLLYPHQTTCTTR